MALSSWLHIHLPQLSLLCLPLVTLLTFNLQMYCCLPCIQWNNIWSWGTLKLPDALLTTWHLYLPDIQKRNMFSHVQALSSYHLWYCCVTPANCYPASHRTLNAILADGYHTWLPGGPFGQWRCQLLLIANFHGFFHHLITSQITVHNHHGPLANPPKQTASSGQQMGVFVRKQIEVADGLTLSGS